MDACGSGVFLEDSIGWTGFRHAAFITALAAASTCACAWIFELIAPVVEGVHRNLTTTEICLALLYLEQIETMSDEASLPISLIGLLPIVFHLIATIGLHLRKYDGIGTIQPSATRPVTVPPQTGVETETLTPSDRTALQSPILDIEHFVLTPTQFSPRLIQGPSRRSMVMEAINAPMGLTAEVLNVEDELAIEPTTLRLLSEQYAGADKVLIRTARPLEDFHNVRDGASVQQPAVERQVSIIGVHDNSAISMGEDRPSPQYTPPRLRFKLPVIDDSFVNRMIAAKRFRGNSAPPTPTTTFHILDRFDIVESEEDVNAYIPQGDLRGSG